MSGGHFDYNQHRITDAIEILEKDLGNADSYLNGMEPDIVESAKQCLQVLREAHTRLHRLDWLLSGDDGEASYRKRLAEDLKGL